MVDRIVSWFLFTFVSITQLHSHLTTLHELFWPHFPRFNQHEPLKVGQTGLNGWTGWLNGSHVIRYIQAFSIRNFSINYELILTVRIEPTAYYSLVL